MKDLKTLSREQLEDLLDGHDCHLSPADGCDCYLIDNELSRRMALEMQFEEERREK